MAFSQDFLALFALDCTQLIIQPYDGSSWTPLDRRLGTVIFVIIDYWQVILHGDEAIRGI
jgi:hypothetical protein